MKKIFSFMTILLLVVTLTGCGSKKETKIKENNAKDSKVENKKVENGEKEITNEGLTSIDLTSSEYDEVGTYDFDLNVNSSIVKFTYVVRDDDGLMASDFIVNDNIVITVNGCGAGGKTVNVLKDTVVISYHMGCDISGNHIAAVNLNGDVLFNYEYLDDNYPGMHVGLGKPTIDSNKIIISGTSTTHGPSLVLDSDYHTVYMCDSEEFSKANISDDYVAGGTYEITYKNGEYNKPVLKDKVTVEEYIKENCNSEY